MVPRRKAVPFDVHCHGRRVEAMEISKQICLALDVVQRDRMRGADGIVCRACTEIHALVAAAGRQLRFECKTDSLACSACNAEGTVIISTLHQAPATCYKPAPRHIGSERSFTARASSPRGSMPTLLGMIILQHQQ